MSHKHDENCAHDHDDHEEEQSSVTSEDVVRHFWGTTVKPETEYKLSLEHSELHLTQACLVGSGAATVFLSTERLKEAVAICSLGHGGGAKHALLDIEVFPEDETATFRVEGTGSVSLSGSIAIFGGELEVEDSDEEGEGEGEEGSDDDDDGALDDEFEGGDDDEEEDEEEEEAPAPAPAAAQSAVEKMKAAKRAREEAEQKEAAAGSNKKAKPATATAAAAAPAPAPAPAAETKKEGKKQEEGKKQAEQNQQQEKGASIGSEKTGMGKLANGMVQFRDAVVGTGVKPVSGKQVTVAYSGRLANGKQFDASSNFKFRIGVGSVIKGWDVGVAGMRVGGKRTLVIHPSFGYGSRGAPPEIPPNATLIFDVELLHAKQ